MGGCKDVPKALAESLVLIAAADGKIHSKEQQELIAALKGIWIAGYGNLKPTLGGAFREVKLAQDFGMDIKAKMKNHARLLARVLTAREKKYFVDRMTRLIRADGEANPKEMALYSVFKEHVEQDQGFISSFQTTLTSFFKK